MCYAMLYSCFVNGFVSTICSAAINKKLKTLSVFYKYLYAFSDFALVVSVAVIFSMTLAQHSTFASALFFIFFFFCFDSASTVFFNVYIILNYCVE